MDRSELAQLFRLFADALEQPLPQVALIPEAAPLAPQRPEKIKAREGSIFISTGDWRQFIIQLERQLREHFGCDPFHLRQLRDFLEDHVELLKGDREAGFPGRSGSPRWYHQIQKAIDCKPSDWPFGDPLIVSAGSRGYYRLA